MKVAILLRTAWQNHALVPVRRGMQRHAGVRRIVDQNGAFLLWNPEVSSAPL